jgi:hypothetical protein
MHVFLIVVAIIAFIGVCALASWTRSSSFKRKYTHWGPGSKQGDSGGS